MVSVGAAYCIYEPSVFLFESVKRVYPVVDKIVFLLNHKPWQGDPSPGSLLNTFRIAASLSDPDNKIEILSGKWESEAEQRNVGLSFLRERGLEWCIVVDDDELYNRCDLEKAFSILGDKKEVAAHLIYHQIYWKNRDTIIKGLFGSFPTLVTTKGLLYFNQDRMILVNKGYTWETVPADVIVCHHMSYVRSDREMFHKIQNFSHADTVVSDWYDRVWLNWKDGMTDFHPTTPEAFKKTLPATASSYFLKNVD